MFNKYSTYTVTLMGVNGCSEGDMVVVGVREKDAGDRVREDSNLSH